MTTSLRLTPISSLAPLIGDGRLVAFDVGPDGTAYFVVALRALDYRTTQPGGASFAKTFPDEPQTYRVIGISDRGLTIDVLIEHERFNVHYVQPLGNELLLACGRSHYKGPDDFERNGRVYTRDGRLSREFLLGDGIESVQTTIAGVIWTSFFDEGVFGNYGWETPVGASGLVAWQPNGQKCFEFEPGDLDSICDCYALNVSSDEDVWIYYYTEFPLVHLHNRKIQAVWEMPLSGSHAFAVSDGCALFRGGYDDGDRYHLFDLCEGRKPKLLTHLELQDERGSKLAADRVVGRADRMYIISKNSLYRVDVRTALTVSGKG